MRAKKAFLVLLLFLLSFGGTAFPLTDQQEIGIGEKYAYYFSERYGVWRDPYWEGKISDIAHRLVRYTKRKLTYTFIILNNKSVNSFALPGGFIMIDRGILPYLKSDDECAAVLAHEISHVELDHFGREYGRVKTINWIGLAANILTGGRANQWERLFAISYNYILEPHWSRIQETQADLNGVDLMVKAGYNPYGMIELFQEMNQKGIGKPPLIPWTASHPDFPARIGAIREEIAKLGYEPAKVVTSHVIEGEVLPESPMPRKNQP